RRQNRQHETGYPFLHKRLLSVNNSSRAARKEKLRFAKPFGGLPMARHHRYFMQYPRRMEYLSGNALDSRLREFLSEDIGGLDVTTEATVLPDARARGTLLARCGCIVSGLPIARRVFELLDPRLLWEGEFPAGEKAQPGATLAILTGQARAIA